MVRNKTDLHGNAPQNSQTVLLLIDVINDFNFPEADQLLECALPAARSLKQLKKRCVAAGIPVVYANDNFGIWRSDFKQVLGHCLAKSCKGRAVSQLLKPTSDDYFVLKPKHSGFFSTTLGILLDYLGSRKLIIGGFAGNICVLFTANDAYMKDFKLYIPRDCVASNTAAENEHALEQMAKLLKADTTVSNQLMLKSGNVSLRRRTQK